MDPALRAAVLGAQNIAAPASPNAAWASPEIAQAAASSFQLPQSMAGANAIGQQAEVDVKAQEEAAAFEEKRKAAMLDPNKYQKLPKEDGGYAFLDPQGNEISAHDYSRVTGQSLDSVLADSENPIDIGFQEDYNNLRDFLSAVQNNDKETVDAIMAENPELNNYKDDIPALIKQFQNHYPTVYGLKQNGNQPVNRTYVPSTKIATSKLGGYEDAQIPG
jgi:hypothetical protein